MPGLAQQFLQVVHRHRSSWGSCGRGWGVDQRRTLDANSPCGRAIRISTIRLSVSTLAIEPVMKNSLIDCVCAMPKADATVPSRLAAPPKVTTRKASTM